LIVVENPADGGAVVHDHLVLLGERFDGDGRVSVLTHPEGLARTFFAERAA
jgi:hypothetical protein